MSDIVFYPPECKICGEPGVLIVHVDWTRALELNHLDHPRWVEELIDLSHKTDSVSVLCRTHGHGAIDRKRELVRSNI